MEARITSAREKITEAIQGYSVTPKTLMNQRSTGLWVIRENDGVFDPDVSYSVHAAAADSGKTWAQFLETDKTVAKMRGKAPEKKALFVHVARVVESLKSDLKATKMVIDKSNKARKDLNRANAGTDKEAQEKAKKVFDDAKAKADPVLQAFDADVAVQQASNFQQLATILKVVAADGLTEISIPAVDAIGSDTESRHTDFITKLMDTGLSKDQAELLWTKAGTGLSMQDLFNQPNPEAHPVPQEEVEKIGAGMAAREARIAEAQAQLDAAKAEA